MFPSARRVRALPIVCVSSVICLAAADASAAVIRVAAGGNLQAALDAAQPGDVVLLPPGAVFRGNYWLRVKSGSDFVTVRTDVAESGAYAPGVRMTPEAGAALAKIQSPNSTAAIRTVAGAHHWRLQLLQFGPNDRGYGDIIDIGDGSKAQNTLDKVPAHFVLDRLYVFGDPLVGQKRGIAINAADVTVTNSTIRDIKGVGQDTQALGAFNGPGPFLIENNYLEAAGENFLLGGTDPPIAGLVATGITFRRNYLSRPLEWRDPIVPAPQGVAATVQDGGALPAGAYAYAVLARRPAGQTTIARSLPSTAPAVTLTAPGAVSIRWSAVPHATEYVVYRSSPGGTVSWTVTAPSFTDTGSGGTAGAVPTSATMWSIKNIFELKNARDVLIEQNVFENNWEAAQAGYAIVFTVRNSGGACTWCTIQNVEFRYNIVRHTAGGVNILGIDARPSIPASNLRLHDNLFYDVSKKTWGGSGVFVLLGDGPQNVVIDHNTVDHDGSTVVSVYGGTPSAPETIPGFRYTNNLSRHNAYGIFGSGLTYGIVTINAYFPDSVVERNLLAGGPAARYPGNFVSPSFESQFVDLGAADYHLVAGSPFRGAGTDGKDLGADLSAFGAATTPPAAFVATPPVAPQSLRIVRSGGQ
jgi:hypothetical protein